MIVISVILPGLSGMDRLLSVMLSPYRKSDSEFKGKIALYVDEERKQHELLYSDIIRFMKEDDTTC
jgi:hypothetical protein